MLLLSFLNASYFNAHQQWLNQMTYTSNFQPCFRGRRDKCVHACDTLRYIQNYMQH